MRLTLKTIFQYCLTDLQKLIEEKKPDDGKEQVCVLLKMAPSLIGPRFNK